MSALVFVMPLPPQSTNTGGRGKSRHWRTTERDKTAYWRCLDTIALVCARTHAPTTDGWLIPPPPAAPIHRATLAADCLVAGAHDDDNMLARTKYATDWLVANGYLATDRRERKKDGASCRWATLPEQRVSRKEPARITLTLTPSED